MLEILGLLVAQPEPPPMPPEIGFISELKKSVGSSPRDQKLAQLADQKPEQLIEQAKSLCLSPTMGGIRTDPTFQRLALKWFCRISD